MSSFKEEFDTYNWEETKQSIYAKSANDVQRALSATHRNLDDFKALISPAAAPYLEQMAQLSMNLTKKRFGKTIQVYTPMYLSNECTNICTYCGFSFENKIPRKTLSNDEILSEIYEIKKHGIEHILLVTGEANSIVNIDYFKESITLVKDHFANISIEVQPLEEYEYHELHELGVYAVLVYQETYNRENYNVYHTKGKKSNFNYRLDTPDRLGRAGIHKIGLGVLLGLDDWRTDSFFCASHIDFLQKTYWQSKYSISFPRIRPAQGLHETGINISDRELVQLICAYRIFNEELEISVSTRESEKFRNNIIRLGATTMSAGSKTNPGGHALESESLEQFEICDERSAEELSKAIRSCGYDAVYKDWDRSLSGKQIRMGSQNF